MVKVSFVCPIFNKSKYLKDVLNALNKQTGNFEKEFIFVNDGSSDNSLELLKSLTKGWKNKKILSQKNKGPASATQRGIDFSTGDYIKLVGDESLSQRDFERVISPLQKMGASFRVNKRKTLPLKIIGSNFTNPINYFENKGSAQCKSTVMLAALNSAGQTIIKAKKSRDHTENIFRYLGIPISVKKKKSGDEIRVVGQKLFKSFKYKVPSDPSSSAFFIILALLSKNCELKIEDVNVNQTRIGFYELLKKHGANIKFYNKRKRDNEIIGDINIKSGKLKKPIIASKNFYEKTTDEFPILFCIAALTKGTSVFKGIQDLANKESNRIKEMQKVLKQIGIKSISTKNEMRVYGRSFIESDNKKITIPNLGDHRICMSSVILSLVTGIKARINNFETVNTSSPNFLRIIKSLGANFEIKK